MPKGLVEIGQLTEIIEKKGANHQSSVLTVSSSDNDASTHNLCIYSATGPLTQPWPFHDRLQPVATLVTEYDHRQ